VALGIVLSLFGHHSKQIRVTHSNCRWLTLIIAQTID